MAPRLQVRKQAIACTRAAGTSAGSVGAPDEHDFGGTATVERYKGDPRVQVHGPGFSKILLGDDVVDNWRDYIDIMADSVYLNSGRGCINCSGVWASRHTKEIAEALAQRLGPIDVKPPEDPQSMLAAFTVPARRRQFGA
jgi:hypothetical protein